jgi:hypothetical protein
MHIQLTAQQEQEVRQGRAVEVTDPATQQVYLVMAREAYDRRPAVSSHHPLPETAAAIPPMLHRSQQAYWRDLPALLPLRSRARRWVAYHGDERIGIGRTETELYQECFRRGLRRDEVYVGRLEATDIPPWATIRIDRSPFEATDAAGGHAPDSAV